MDTYVRRTLCLQNHHVFLAAPASRDRQLPGRDVREYNGDDESPHQVKRPRFTSRERSQHFLLVWHLCRH